MSKINVCPILIQVCQNKKKLMSKGCQQSNIVIGKTH